MLAGKIITPLAEKVSKWALFGENVQDLIINFETRTEIIAPFKQVMN